METESDGEDAAFPHRPLIVDGADAAIIGYIHRPGEAPFVVYDRQKLLLHLMSDGTSESDACDWIDYNIAATWAGPGTPAILHACDIDGVLDAFSDYHS